MNFSIKKITHAFDEEIQATIDGKTKPLGALGQLEDTAKRIARVQLSSSNNNNKSLSVNKPNLFVFAGDHGVAAEGVGPARSGRSDWPARRWARRSSARRGGEASPTQPENGT